ncbi:hypothetical protein HPB47_015997, partial [Ixodes persulcatus]
IDATGKYPTGLFQGTLSDIGAFDQCIETVIHDDYGNEKVRAQYCNLYIKFGKDLSIFQHVDDMLRLSHRRTPLFARYQQDERVHGVRIGLCVLHECNEVDLENFFKLRKLVKYLTAFSIPANTRPLLAVNRDKQSDAYNLRFLHGMRFFSLVWVVLGHSYSTFNSSNVSRLVNALHYGDDIAGCFITGGYLSVDTFLFLAGFLLTYNLMRERGNGFVGGCIALVRRWIRSQYWALLLQIRNFTKDLHIGMYGHLWYMSTDFQLFVVSVFIIQLFKKVAVGTLNEVYPHPSYHGAAFFLGAITQLLLIKYSSVKISKMFQAGMWLITATCGLTAILSMYEWNRGAHPPEWAKLSFAFSERLLWAIWLSWLTFACATGRGSFISHFLSWGAFAPLSRLSFGVYVLHVPYYFIRLCTARERLFFSHLTMVTQCFGALVTSYLLSLVLFVVCEAPTGRLEKLILMPSRRPEKPSGTNDDKPCVEDAFKNFSAPDLPVKEKGMQDGNRNVYPSEDIPAKRRAPPRKATLRRRRLSRKKPSYQSPLATLPTASRAFESSFARSSGRSLRSFCRLLSAPPQSQLPEVVRDEVQRAFLPDAAVTVAAADEPTLTYTAVA